MRRHGTPLNPDQIVNLAAAHVRALAFVEGIRPETAAYWSGHITELANHIEQMHRSPRLVSVPTVQFDCSDHRTLLQIVQCSPITKAKFLEDGNSYTDTPIGQNWKATAAHIAFAPAPTMDDLDKARYGNMLIKMSLRMACLIIEQHRAMINVPRIFILNDQPLKTFHLWAGCKEGLPTLELIEQPQLQGRFEVPTDTQFVLLGEHI